MIENRKTYRLPFRTKVILGDEEIVTTGNATNISAGGLFVMLLKPFARDTRLQAVFQLHPERDPICLNCVVKRVIQSSANVDEIPGIGLNFVDDNPQKLQSLREFMIESRKDFEMASAILNSGEPDLNSLDPLLARLHLPPFSDLGELRFYIERILKSMELVDRSLR